MSTNFLILFGISFVAFVAFNDISATKISWGAPVSKTEHEIILNRVILNRTTAVPTNYTIIYKYIRAELSGFISFIEFECKNCTLTGNISKNANVGPRKENVVSATLDIQDGTDVEVWVRIYGVGASISSRLSVDPFTVEFLGDKLFEPKSFALVYAHNVTQKRHHLISLGERQPGDHLVKFDSKFIQRTSTNNFPESEFEYSQTDAYLTHISFSFDSPSAILFVNSTNIRDSSFDAIVYDLNRAEFTANMSIYGYIAIEKPTKWKSIIP